MTHVVVVTQEPDGSIKLTKERLQSMLDDAYKRGYEDGNRSTTITYPSYPSWVYTSDSSITNAPKAPKVTLEKKES